jgi:hypothetical protein
MKRIILAITAIAFIAISCNKNTVVNQPTQIGKQSMRVINSGLKIENGIMVFSSIDALDAKVQELHSMTSDELNLYNQSYSDFTSLYRQYQILDEQADAENGISADSTINARLIVDIPDNVFASIVSKDGLLIVADSIYYYSSGGYQVTDTINHGKNTNFNWSIIAKKGFGQGNNGNPEWAAFPPISKFFHTYNGSNSWPKHNGRNVRAIHTKWCSWFGVYGSAGAKIKLEKDSKYGGWINIEHANASNSTSSNFRYFTMFSGGGNQWWAWDYFTKNDNKNTSSKNVNEIVLTYKVSLIAGPLQHQVGNFVNTVSITRQGCTLTTTWNH